MLVSDSDVGEDKPADVGEDKPLGDQNLQLEPMFTNVRVGAP